MRKYLCFYKKKTMIVEAQSLYEAQQIAATRFKAKKRFDVRAILADVPVNTASL